MTARALVKDQIAHEPNVEPAEAPAADARDWTDAPFDDPGWILYDGFRMIAEIRRGKGRALQPQWQNHQPQLYRGRQGTRTRSERCCVIDGELVAIGKDGVSHFQLLQKRAATRGKASVLRFRPEVRATAWTCGSSLSSSARDGSKPSCPAIS
jgi:hypothetical protein